MKNEIVTRQHKGDERNDILWLSELSYTHDNFQDWFPVYFWSKQPSIWKSMQKYVKNENIFLVSGKFFLAFLKINLELYTHRHTPFDSEDCIAHASMKFP